MGVLVHADNDLSFGVSVTVTLECFRDPTKCVCSIDHRCDLSRFNQSGPRDRAPISLLVLEGLVYQGKRPKALLCSRLRFSSSRIVTHVSIPVAAQARSTADRGPAAAGDTFYTCAEAHIAIWHWIESWCDLGRRHSVLGSQSPIEWEIIYLRNTETPAK
jgi:hypothetical protein